MRKLSFILFFSIIAFSCSLVNKDRVRGNGVIKSESRSLATFQGVDVSGALDVIITQDSALKVMVESDDNLLEYIRTEIDGSVLKIFPERGFDLDPTKKILIHVSAPSYLVVEASGASTVRSNGRISNKDRISLDASGASSIELQVDVPEVFTDISGASDISLKGMARSHVGEASGASTIKAFELMTEQSDISVSGASGAQVFASVKLHAAASGASDVKYKGNPVLSSKTSGASDVVKAD